MTRYLLMSVLLMLLFPPVGIAVFLTILAIAAFRHAARDGGPRERDRADRYMGTGRYRVR